MLTLGQKVIVLLVLGIIDILALLFGGIFGLLVVIPSIVMLAVLFRF